MPHFTSSSNKTYKRYKLFYNIKTDLTVNMVCNLKHFTSIIKYKENNLLSEQCTIPFITLTHS
jgi:hypothetical protein